MLRTLFLFEKYKTNIDDIGGKRRYSRNILQWCKNDSKIKKSTNGDYSNIGQVSYYISWFRCKSIASYESSCFFVQDTSLSKVTYKKWYSVLVVIFAVMAISKRKSQMTWFVFNLTLKGKLTWVLNADKVFKFEHFNE